MILYCFESGNYPDTAGTRPADIRDSLRDMKHEVTVEPEIAERARIAVERMLEIKV